MKRCLLTVIALFLLLTANTPAQNSDWILSLYGGYITKSEMFFYPNSSKPELRNNAFRIEDLLLPGISVKYAVDSDIFTMFSVEYIEGTSIGRNVTIVENSATKTVAVEDGFSVIPVELSVIYRMPFSTELFNFFMGGGLGYYFGNHIRSIGNVNAETIDREAAYGLHVMLTMEYLPAARNGIFLSMKFRDPKIDMVSEYSSTTGERNGIPFQLGRSDFDSSVNINGITFLLGYSYYF